MWLFKNGVEFTVDDLCPPLCNELWNSIHSFVYALQNGVLLDYGDCRAKVFDAGCPDEGVFVFMEKRQINRFRFVGTRTS